MQRKKLALVALGLFVAGQVLSQTPEQLPPIARPPPPDFGPPPAQDQPPAETFRLLPPTERFQSPPPGPGTPELRQSDEQQRSTWRAAIEEEFGAVWGRYGCFPHPQRHGEWFYEFADRQGAASPDQQRLLYELTMERVAAYEPPLSPPERVRQSTQRWLDELIGRLSRPAAPDYFCR